MALSIWREQFIKAIELGIEDAANYINEVDGGLDLVRFSELLRAVGQTAERFVVGDFYNEWNGCGCPLTQAGLIQFGTSDVTDLAREINYINGFWSAFDHYTFEILKSYGKSALNGDIVHVIGDPISTN